MKKTNKKGFTIVELVIVIAVIAILAGVLIPTFSGVVEKARMSSCEQVAVSIYKEVYALDLADGKIDGKGLEDVDIEKIGKGTAEYIVNKNGEVESFVYRDGKYKSTYDPATGWKTEASDTNTD